MVHALQKIFTKPGKIKYSNIHLLAVILGSLHRYHQDFTTTVIDDLLENITLGLEVNDFKFNQRRIAEVKYLGELYIYRMVDSPVIFDTMYKILTYGHENGTPRPSSTNPLDLPDDYFRIRLACNLIETCGMYFDKGVSKKKFDFFLTFFQVIRVVYIYQRMLIVQYYIQTKENIPMDIDFMVRDAYELTRPQWKLAVDLEEASRLFADAVKQNYQASSAERGGDLEEEVEDSPSDHSADDEDLAAADVDEDKSSGEDADVSLA